MSLTHCGTALGPEIHLALPPSAAWEAPLPAPARSPTELLSEYWGICLLLMLEYLLVSARGT